MGTARKMRNVVVVTSGNLFGGRGVLFKWFVIFSGGNLFSKLFC